MKTNKTNPWFWAFLVLLLVNLAAISTMLYTLNDLKTNMLEQPLPPPPPNTPGNPPMMNFNKIIQKNVGFSNDQIQRLRAVKITHMTHMRQFKMDLDTLQKSLFDEVAAENPDKNKIDTLKKEIATIQVSLIDESIKFYDQIKNESTPDQLQKLNNYYRQHHFKRNRFNENRPYKRRNNRNNY